jgi:predicted butyrate kinase (DUF1464 family)
MIRVAGTDPGTSSLDIVVLEDGRIVGERRFGPSEWGQDPHAVVQYLKSCGPLDLVAGPSGYGLPLKRADQVTDVDIDLMTLVRPDHRGQDEGVLGFRRLLRTLTASGLPIVFLPGIIHLPTVPAHRKINRIDLGTADKLCVAALAVWEHAVRHQLSFDECNLCLVEAGSAFTAVLVVKGGQVIDGWGGTSGPVGWASGGAWDGEVAYLLGPLSKQDLFDGGVRSVAAADSAGSTMAPPSLAMGLFRESLVRAVAAAQAIHQFEHIAVSGRLLEDERWSVILTLAAAQFGAVHVVSGLPGTRLKHAAQGAALIADGLAGGQYRDLIEHLAIARASGTVLDGLRYSRSSELRRAFGVGDS